MKTNKLIEEIKEKSDKAFESIDMKIKINIGVVCLLINIVSMSIGKGAVIPLWLCLVSLLAELKLRLGK